MAMRVNELGNVFFHAVVTINELMNGYARMVLGVNKMRASYECIELIVDITVMANYRMTFR